jgi:hypothetical protein
VSGAEPDETGERLDIAGPHGSLKRRQALSKRNELIKARARFFSQNIFQRANLCKSPLSQDNTAKILLDFGEKGQHRRGRCHKKGRLQFFVFLKRVLILLEKSAGRLTFFH